MNNEFRFYRDLLSVISLMSTDSIVWFGFSELFAVSKLDLMNTPIVSNFDLISALNGLEEDL